LSASSRAVPPGNPADKRPKRGIFFFGCCASATEARTRPISKTTTVLISVPALVYSGSLSVVQSVFSCPLLMGYGIAGNRVINRCHCTSRARGIAPSRERLEHPRPYALGGHRLSSTKRGEPRHHREGKIGLGKTSLVPEPNGRRGSKTFHLPIKASCCLCRRPGGPMIFASVQLDLNSHTRH
jgi:hypothetical protein